MKKIIYVSVLLSFFIFINIATAKNISEYNGTEWNQFTENLKVFFVTGFIAGADYVVTHEPEIYRDDFREGFDMKKGGLLSQKIWPQNKNKRNITFTKEEIIFWGQYRSALRTTHLLYTYSTELTVGQIIIGLNTFYQDFKNSNITIPDAIYVVKQQIKGLSSEDTEKILLYLRGEKQDPKLLDVRDSEGNIIGRLAFP